MQAVTVTSLRSLAGIISAELSFLFLASLLACQRMRPSSPWMLVLGPQCASNDSNESL